MGDITHLVGHRARADPFEQCGHTGGVAQPCAVVHIVGAKAGAHQFLKQVGLLVRAFGRAKTGQCIGAVLIADFHQRTTRQIERFLPCGFTEHVAPVVRVDAKIRRLGHARLADQWRGQTLRVVRVIKTKPPLHTQP